MRRFLSLLVLMVAIGVCVREGSAAPPQVDADPNRDYPVIPQAGEWMICVAYYTGPEAPDLAKQMVYQLRSKLNLPAYAYSHVDPVLKQKKEELDNAHKQALKLIGETGAWDAKIPKRTIRVETQYAVMIGGWDKMDDATNYLHNRLRKQKAPEVNSVTGRTTRETRWELRKDEQTEKWTYKLEPVDPFSTASVTRNPTVKSPREANKPDPLLIKLNEDNEYSLLKCQRGWTLFVREFSGVSEIVGQTPTGPQKEKTGSFFDRLVGGYEEYHALQASEHNAMEMAKVLRKLNFDAYVLHMRTSSVVTIGGFTGPDDPAINRTTQQITQLRQQMISQTKQDVLQLFQTPLLVEIPRPQ